MRSAPILKGAGGQRATFPTFLKAAALFRENMSSRGASGVSHVQNIAIPSDGSRISCIKGPTSWSIFRK